MSHEKVAWADIYSLSSCPWVTHSQPDITPYLCMCLYQPGAQPVSRVPFSWSPQAEGRPKVNHEPPLTSGTPYQTPEML